MKKILIALLLCIASVQSNACDICGCGISNYNPFLFPYLSQNYIRFNYIHRLYHTYPENAIAGKEYYNSLMITGQYSITKRLQVLATIPFQYNVLKNENGTVRQSGPGDISLTLNYKLLDRMTMSNRQVISIGAGVKAPTGKYISSGSKDNPDQNFQLGSGSTDYLLNASYMISFKQWVLSAATSYKYNTQNKDNFRFGDVLNTGVTVAYKLKADQFSITPYLQLVQERQMEDAADHILQAHSGGNALYTGGGLDIGNKKLVFGANYQFATHQSIAGGEICVKPRFTAHLSIIL